MDVLKRDGVSDSFTAFEWTLEASRERSRPKTTWRRTSKER